MDNHGFTLIELLLSLFVITIITTLVITNVIDEVKTNQVKVGSRQVVTSLEWGRSCAMATNVDATIRFSSNHIVVKCNHNEQLFSTENVEISTNFPNDTAIFNERGVVNQGATINICNEAKCEQVTIGIGRSDVQIK